MSSSAVQADCVFMHRSSIFRVLPLKNGSSSSIGCRPESCCAASLHRSIRSVSLTANSAACRSSVRSSSSRTALPSSCEKNASSIIILPKHRVIYLCTVGKLLSFSIVFSCVRYMLRGIWHTNLCLRGCEKTARRALCFSHPENRGIIQTESPYFVRCVYYTTAATVIAKKIIQKYRAE